MTGGPLGGGCVQSLFDNGSLNRLEHVRVLIHSAFAIHYESMPTLKQAVYDILDYDPECGRVEKIVTVGLVLLIIANILAVILQTEPLLGEMYAPFFDAFETISVVIFTIEYLLRLWSITVDPRFRDPVSGRLRFMVTPLAIIDVVSILPFYLPFFIPVDLRTLRVLRLLRVFRLFKVGRYSQAMEIFVRVYRSKQAELLVAVAIALVLLVISSSLMYSVEHDVQPDKFPSIIGTMWWAMATLTTIGYGDVAPITPIGKLLSSCIAVIGIALFGLPAGIFASGFIEELQGKRELPSVCPHCGETLENSPKNGRP